MKQNNLRTLYRFIPSFTAQPWHTSRAVSPALTIRVSP
jgi:hypothetical protein